MARRFLRLAALLVPLFAQPAIAEVARVKFTGPPGYLIVEALADDLLHVEISAVGDGPAPDQPLYASPMVCPPRTPVRRSFSRNGGVIETAELRAAIDAATLCVRLEDKTRGDAYLTTLCPVDLGQPLKGLDIDPGR